MGISIHAPVKGATRLGVLKGTYCETISIHAPVKGATFAFVSKVILHALFQSTHP